MAEEMQTTVVEATAESSEEQLTYEEWLLGVDHDLRVICNGSEGILGIQEEIELNRHGTRAKDLRHLSKTLSPRTPVGITEINSQISRIAHAFNDPNIGPIEFLFEIMRAA